jgi:hypothetical protein
MTTTTTSSSSSSNAVGETASSSKTKQNKDQQDDDDDDHLTKSLLMRRRKTTSRGYIYVDDCEERPTLSFRKMFEIRLTVHSERNWNVLLQRIAKPGNPVFFLLGTHEHRASSLWNVMFPPSGASYIGYGAVPTILLGAT